jgi:predicted nucleic acid-binding protein
MKVVSDATPLIHLAAIGRLDLLKELFQEILIPEEVYEEVVLHGRDRPGSVEVCEADWISRCHVPNKAVLQALQTTLGAGEAACIALASSISADVVILDDKLARLHALSQGLKVTGTIGILLRCADREILSFESALQELLATGFRLSPQETKRIMELRSRLAQ